MRSRKVPVAVTVSAALTGALLAAGVAGPTGSATAATAEFDHIELPPADNASLALDEADAREDRGDIHEGDVAPQIFGGRPAADGEFPFSTFVQVETNGIFFRCAGSLISSEWVLTAAHCVADDFGDFLPGLTVLVAAGVTDLDDVTPANVFAATDVFKAVNYSPPTTGAANDLAILRLDRPAPVRGLPLARPERPGVDSPGTRGTFTGWGLLQQDPDVPTNQLQVGSASIRSDAECSAFFPNLPFRYEPGLMNCTGPPLGSPPADPTVCPGDSGGPMFVPFGSDVLQAGITSFGNIPCQDLRRAVYTKVSTYAQAIGNLLQTEQPGLGPPEAATGGVTEQHDDGLTVQGIVDPNGIATAFEVEWGTTPALGAGSVRGHVESAASAQGLAYAGMAAGPVVVSARITGAPAGTVIFYRVSALNAAGIANGQVGSGQTTSPPPPPPAPTSGDAVCTPVPERRTSRRGRVAYTRSALKIQQNIDSAALRRLNAINAWIDAGIEQRDLCASAFGPSAFQAGMSFQGGAAHDASPPTPRPIEIRRQRSRGTITRSLRQVAINERISRALRARSVATLQRVRSLTGGNLAPQTTLSGRAVWPGLQTQGPQPGSRDGPARALQIGALPRGIPIRGNAATLRAQQRRSQRSIRIANLALDAIRAGLTAENFTPGSIGSAHF